MYYSNNPSIYFYDTTLATRWLNTVDDERKKHQVFTKI